MTFSTRVGIMKVLTSICDGIEVTDGILNNTLSRFDSVFKAII